MTPEEREEMNHLCRLIQDEKDHQKFTNLIAKLLEVISRKERRLEEQEKSKIQSGLVWLILIVGF